jgi:hypothetical protein
VGFGYGWQVEGITVKIAIANENAVGNFLIGIAIKTLGEYDPYVLH